MTTFSLKIHDGGQGTVVAACDEELLGETFRDNDTTLTIEESFYNEDTVGIDEVVKATKRCTTTNFVGEELITALITEGIVDEDEVSHVDGVPHVQLFFV